MAQWEALIQAERHEELLDIQKMMCGEETASRRMLVSSMLRLRNIIG
jgi:hypothetical protein